MSDPNVQERHEVTVRLSNSDKPKYAWLATCYCGWQCLGISEDYCKSMGTGHVKVRAMRAEAGGMRYW